MNLLRTHVSKKHSLPAQPPQQVFNSSACFRCFAYDTLSVTRAQKSRKLQGGRCRRLCRAVLQTTLYLCSCCYSVLSMPFRAPHRRRRRRRCKSAVGVPRARPCRFAQTAGSHDAKFWRMAAAVVAAQMAASTAAAATATGFYHRSLRLRTKDGSLRVLRFPLDALLCLSMPVRSCPTSTVEASPRVRAPHRAGANIWPPREHKVDSSGVTARPHNSRNTRSRRAFQWAAKYHTHTYTQTHTPRGVVTRCRERKAEGERSQLCFQ